MPTLDYEQQRFPALFWGFVNPSWVALPRDTRGFIRADPERPPSPWIVTEHQTAGCACKHLVLAGVMVTADPFSLQPLVDSYAGSLLAQWTDLPDWQTLRTYDQDLQAVHLTAPSDDAYRWLQEAFLPVLPDALFDLSQTWFHAQLWTGSDAISAPWPRWADFSALQADLETWQSQGVAAYATLHDAPTEQAMAPLWYRRPLVAAVIFENSD